MVTSPPPGYRQTLTDLADQLRDLAVAEPMDAAKGLASLLDSHSSQRVHVVLAGARRSAVAAVKDAVGGSQYATARLLGLSESSISHILSGRLRSAKR